MTAAAVARGWLTRGCVVLVQSMNAPSEMEGPGDENALAENTEVSILEHSLADLVLSLFCVCDLAFCAL